MDVDITKEDIDKLKNMFEIYKELVNNSSPIEKRGKSFYKPPVSIQQTGDIFTVIAKIPGLKKDDNVKVILSGNILHLSGIKKVKKNDDFSFKQIPFSRVVLLPSYAKQDEVTATYKKDILEIRLIKDKSNFKKEISVDFQ